MHDFQREITNCPMCRAGGISKPFLLRGFTLAECASCGFLYVRDRAAEGAILDYYKYEYYHSGQEAISGYDDYFRIRKEREWTFRRYLQTILPYVVERRQVLDIGCGSGYFLNAARPYFERLAGVDISPEVLKYADHQFTLINSPFRGDLFPPGFANLVMICDLIEHIYRPVEFMRQVGEVLHPGGVVCIVTPNRKSWLARLTGKRWISFKLPEHVSYFDPDSMMSLLQASGFEILARRPCGQYATLDFVSRRVSALLFQHPNGLRLPFLQHFTFFVNSGSMLVLARRSRT